MSNFTNNRLRFVCRWIAGWIALIALAALPGCRKRKTAPGVAANGNAAANTIPSQPNPISNAFTLKIEGQPYAFAKAHLHLWPGDTLGVELYTDDPAGASAPATRRAPTTATSPATNPATTAASIPGMSGVTGNAMSLQMTLDVPDVDSLSGAQWHYQVTSVDRGDDASGIFLEGGARILQPLNVTITFEMPTTAQGAQPKQCLAKLTGQFVVFSQGDADKTPIVNVTGEIPFTIDP